MLKKIVNNLSYYKKKPVPGDGSCFYHSIVLGLNKIENINNTSETSLQQIYDVKYLRNICVYFFEKNKSYPWLLNKIKCEIRAKYQLQYYDKDFQDEKYKKELDKQSSINNINQYIENYIKQGDNNNEWGRPDIEGVIICNSLNINIHLIIPNNINGVLSYSHVLYTPNNVTNLILPNDFDNNYNKLTSNNTICVIHNGNNHFEYAVFSPPILQSDEGYISGSNSAGDDDSESDEFFDTVSDMHPTNEDKDTIELNIHSKYNNTSLKPTTTSQTSNINLIIMTKNIDNTWNIKKQENDKIKESRVLLANNETEVLDSLIQKYKSNMTIIFEKNTKKFKEAFAIDNQGNKKNIYIDEIETIKSLEKIFKKITKVLNQTLNDFDAEKINDLVKQKTNSKSNNNKNSHCRKYMTKM